MRAIAIIPARFGSTRFPGKLLAGRTGSPLIQHVYDRASRARRIDRVLIATDDERIRDAARRFGAEVVMTRVDHPNGTSRLAEAADQLDLQDDTLVVNVQGDEPELDPRLIDASVDVLTDPINADATVSTVASPVDVDEDASNPNIVKVVTSQRQRALYFSRSLIPFDRDHTENVARLRHVGLYVYRRPFLRTYVGLSQTPLERAEQLEQLRILEHGFQIALCVMEGRSTGIDTPEQYDAFVERWQKAHP